jgi:hypothetical protein
MTVALPVDAFSLELDDKEFRLLAAMCHLAASDGVVEATMSDLGILTQRGEENVRRALRGLEAKGLVTTTRTKRNLGRLHKNRYTLTHCMVGSKDAVIHHTVGSTDGTHVVPVITNTTNSQVSRVINTTYLLVGNEVSHKEETMNKWQDDDDTVGFGLLEGELPAKQAEAMVSDKRKPKTRGNRPVTDWTTYDMATEFSYRLSRKFPLIPGLVNVKALAGALAKNRREYGITAVVEMEIMDLFFGDERKWRSAEEHPEKIHGKYLRMFTTNLEEALSNLGMLDQLSDTPPVVQQGTYLYASDGTRFDDSFLGRKALRQYEQELETERAL